MTKHSTLSRRGQEFASADSIRDKFELIIKNPYDPDTNPGGFVNIGVAENFALLPEITDFVNSHAKFNERDFSYGEGPWGSKRLRNAMAKFINDSKEFNVHKKVDPEHLTFAAGCTGLCEILGFTIADPGDAIILPRPIYQAFQMDFGMRANMKPVFVDFDDADQFSVEGVKKFEETIEKTEKSGTKVRALMLCNPHNPLGQCYPKDTIIALMKLCSKYGIHLISDEIYSHSVYEVPDENAVKFTSVLSFDTSPYIDSDYLHLLYGMSKDFAGGGLRLGVIYLRNKELLRAVSTLCPFSWSSNPSQQIAAIMLEDEKWMKGFLDLGRQRLAARNKLTRQILDDAGIKYHKGANAGFFMWLDLRPWLPSGPSLTTDKAREDALIAKLLEKKVFVTPGLSLTAEGPGFVRVIFSQEERVIKEGLKRLCDACGIKQSV